MFMADLGFIPASLEEETASLTSLRHLASFAYSVPFAFRSLTSLPQQSLTMTIPIFVRYPFYVYSSALLNSLMRADVTRNYHSTQ